MYRIVKARYPTPWLPTGSVHVFAKLQSSPSVGTPHRLTRSNITINRNLQIQAALAAHPQLIREDQHRCLLQIRSPRHRTPQIFRSQFETKVHNQIRKRVENYVENRSSHVRNPVFYEQICDELLSGFTMIARSGQAERNELLERGDTPEEGGRRVDLRYQTSLATSTGVIRDCTSLLAPKSDASDDHIWATTPGS